ncbi:MAG: peptide chain release factor-like protein [Elusimicrobiota bacterium]
MDELEGRMRDLGISRDEVQETFTRSGGKGGQHVNKVSTCVVVRHLPTGVVVRCDTERSQSRNRALAWKRLLDKIEERRRAARAARRAAAEKERRRKRKRPRALKESILKAKKRRSETKKLRQRVKRWD